MQEFDLTLIRPLLDQNQRQKHGLERIAILGFSVASMLASFVLLILDHPTIFMCTFIFAFLFMIAGVFIQDLRNKKNFRKLSQNRSDLPYEKIGKAILRPQNISIYMNKERGNTFALNEIKNFSIRNEDHDGRVGLADSRVYKNNANWFPLRKGYLNYFTFETYSEKQKIEKISFNFLLKNEDEAENLQEFLSTNILNTK